MITKTGYAISYVLPPLRSFGLDKEQQRALAEKYDMSEDSNFGLRTLGRGGVGFLGGGLASNMFQHLLPQKLQPALKYPLNLGGSWLGMKLMTDKYSPELADELIKRKNGKVN